MSSLCGYVRFWIAALQKRTGEKPPYLVIPHPTHAGYMEARQRFPKAAVGEPPIKDAWCGDLLLVARRRIIGFGEVLRRGCHRKVDQGLRARVLHPVDLARWGADDIA